MYLLDYIELSKKADDEFDVGRIDEARTLLNKGLAQAKKKGNQPYIEFFSGELDNINGDYESAINHHKKAVELDPENPFLLENLVNSLRNKGVSLSKLGKGEEANELFNKALEIKPDDYHTLRNKGASLSELGKGEEAIELYNQALKIKPDDYNSLRNKGVSLSKLGKEEEAIELYNQALEIKPDDYNSLQNKGVSLSKLGKEEEAIELYNQVLKIKPDDWYALISKAITLENIKNINEAKKIYKDLHANLEKIKDKEIIDIVNFKIGFFGTKKRTAKKDVGKSSDILNEVVNAFKDKRDIFFKSIDEIESSFKDFTDTNRSIPDDFPSFLSVLRKWNSYTPIIPSKKGDNKGGGYFLYHKGKGIVIDPGFNFIENFYQEGFKVADIDAVLITHAHNDHTVDLESILTLVYKYNDAIEDSVRETFKGKDENEIKVQVGQKLEETGKKIDLFLNVGTFMKYSGWLNLKDSHEINSVTVLQPDTTYNLSAEYNEITLHTTKAKHHEVIDDKYAIGVIFEIKNVQKIGFTGDTGWDYENNGSIAEPFLRHNPKLVVAHLGSIKRKEFNYVSAKDEEERNECFYAHHLGLLGMTKFLEATTPDLTIISEFGEELRPFRKEIVQGIGKVLKLNCLPGDIGLHIKLKDLGVHCFIDDMFVDYKKIKTYFTEEETNISYHRDEPDHEKFNTALKKKNRLRAVPLYKRVSDLT